MKVVFFVVPRYFRRGFTLVELLVVIGVIALLSGLVISGVTNAKNSAIKVRCASNLRQVAILHLAYAGANKDVFCPAWDNSRRQWDISANYLKSGILEDALGLTGAQSNEVYECPLAEHSLYFKAGKAPKFAGYGYNYLLSFEDVAKQPPNYRWARTTQIKNPVRVVILSDAACMLSSTAEAPSPTSFLFNSSSHKGGYADFRHRGVVNTAFCDGHVDGVTQGYEASWINANFADRLKYFDDDDKMYLPFPKPTE